MKHDLTFPNPVFWEIINLLSAELAQRVVKVNLCNVTLSLDEKLSDLDKDYQINPKFWDRQTWIKSGDLDQWIQHLIRVYTVNHLSSLRHISR